MIWELKLPNGHPTPTVIVEAVSVADAYEKADELLESRGERGIDPRWKAEQIELPYYCEQV